MLQMYIIFINDNALILSGSKEILNGFENVEVKAYNDSSSIDEALFELQTDSCKELFLVGSCLPSMWDDFCARFQLIEAAGGVVTNSKKQVLWIRRNDKWDLPKGKVEVGEQIQEAAVREVKEECGLTSIRLGVLLGVTYHTYSCKDVNVLKKSYWFSMSCPAQQDLIPQLEEGITEVVWADAALHQMYLENTYASISELLRQEKVQLYLGF
jgi:8-oxo-dGTP pyrophosphatase MutT (NUDIX family)